jgi:hypothetical protein
MLFLLSLSLAGGLSSPAAAQGEGDGLGGGRPGPLPVQDLQCQCLEGGEVQVRWVNGDLYTLIEIALDGQLVLEIPGQHLPGAKENAVLRGVAPGDHKVEVVGAVDLPAPGLRSPPVVCAVSCAVAPPVQPVQGLVCKCGPDGELRIEWINGDLYEAIEILLDTQPPRTLPGPFEAGTAGAAALRGVPPGPHQVQVIGIRGGARSAPEFCREVVCPEPVAVIDGPSRLILPPGGALEMAYDGRRSRDAAGGEALGFFWRSPEEELPDPPLRILDPRSALTRVVFRQAGIFNLVLVVVRKP